MTHSSSESILLPIAALRKIHAVLAKEDAETLERLEVRCVACDIYLSAGEIRQLCSSAPVGPKLDRLNLGYCARRTCDSRFYRVRAPSASPRAQSALQSLAWCPPTAPPKFETTLIRSARIWKLCACAIPVGYALFLFHHWYFGERIPLLQKEHHYSTAPSVDSASFRNPLRE